MRWAGNHHQDRVKMDQVHEYVMATHRVSPALAKEALDIMGKRGMGIEEPTTDEDLAQYVAEAHPVDRALGALQEGMTERRIVVVTNGGQVEQCYLLEDVLTDAEMGRLTRRMSEVAESRGYRVSVRTPWAGSPMRGEDIAARLGDDISRIMAGEDEG